MAEGALFLTELDLSIPLTISHDNYVSRSEEILFFRLTIDSKDIIFSKGGFWTVKINEKEKEIINKILTKAKLDLLSEPLLNFFRASADLNTYYGEIIFTLSIQHQRYPDLRHHFFHIYNISIDNSKLFNEINRLKEENKMLKAQVDFQPDGPGYLETKKHFEKLLG